jgi:hypothetical protein
MLIHQHIFGKTRIKDFTTLAVSLNLPPDELRILEQRSRYQLPGSIYRTIGMEKPKKYVYYSLSDKLVVVGRGVDIGLDESGRSGNFVFHNFIIPIQSIETCNMNPIHMIQYIEKEGFFISREFDHENIEPREMVFSADSKTPIKIDRFKDRTKMISHMLYLCFNPQENKPICLLGSEDKLLPFMEDVFNILPLRLWNKLSFNTCWSQDMDYLFCGFCIKEEQRFPAYSIKIELDKGEYDSKLTVFDDAKTKYSEAVTDLILKDEAGYPLLYSFYSLESAIISNSWDKFANEFRVAKENISELIFQLYLKEIINGVVNNAEVYVAIKNKLSDDGRANIFKSKEFIGSMMKCGNGDIMGEYVNWYYSQSNAFVDQASIFVSYGKLFDLLIDKMNNNKRDMSKNMGIVLQIYRAIFKQKEANESLEEKLLETMSSLFVFAGNDNDSDLAKLIKRLPETTNQRLALLRILIRYKVGDKGGLASLVKDEKYINLISYVLDDAVKMPNWERYRRCAN